MTPRRCNAAIVCEQPAGHADWHVGHTPNDTMFSWANDNEKCPAASNGMHCDQTLTNHRHSTDGEPIHSGWTVGHHNYLSWWASYPTVTTSQPD